MTIDPCSTPPCFFLLAGKCAGRRDTAFEFEAVRSCPQLKQLRMSPFRELFSFPGASEGRWGEVQGKSRPGEPRTHPGGGC